MTAAHRWHELADRVLAGHELTGDEALAALGCPDDELLGLLDAAFRVRRHRFGRIVRVHVLRNAKSGACPEDCAYCSQSIRYAAPIVPHGMESVEALVEDARRAQAMGASTWCMVTATRRPNNRDLDVVCEAVRRIKAELEVDVCTSLGLLDPERAARLAAAGVDRYNHNLETSRRYFDTVCTTHGWEDRVETVRLARAAGMQACSGGILGLGEGPRDRVDLALALRELGVESVPINLFDPRPGTPLATRTPLAAQEGLKALAMFRLVLPDRDVRIAGGREVVLGPLQVLAPFVATSLFADGYLTTPGQPPSELARMLAATGFSAEIEGVEGEARVTGRPPAVESGGVGPAAPAASPGTGTTASLPERRPRRRPAVAGPREDPAGRGELDRATLAAWDDRHTWHPFTPHSVYRAEAPLLVERADGPWLVDVDGRRLLDGVGSLWCNLLGHRHPHIDAAIRAQLDRVAHSTWLGNSSVPGVLLARRLIQLAPEGLSRVFYSDDGSTAVEVALKMALQFHQQAGEPGGRARTRFLSFGEAYHGDTIGAVSAGGMPLFHARFGPLLFDVERAPSPFAWRARAGGDPQRWLRLAVDDLAARMAEGGARLAAVVVEPGVQGAAGMLTQPPGWVAAVRALCDQHGVLLIADEVAVGMGRSGRLFACQREGVRPDLLCLAKGLTGGYLPLAATLATERVFSAFLGPPEQGRTFFHGHTYTGNALGAAAGLATLDILTDGGVLAQVPRRIERLTGGLARLAGLPAVRDVRQYGLAAGVELCDPRDGSALDAAARTGMAVCRAACRRGVFLRPLGDVIVLMPPLTLDDAGLDMLLDATHEAIAEVLPGDRALPATEPPRRPDATLVLVCGTDTGVGKTWVASRLAAHLCTRGDRVIALKPVESGVGDGPPAAGEDGVQLAMATGQERPRCALDRLPEPLAPPLAAERAGRRLDPTRWRDALDDAMGANDIVLVEGAGGLLSPLTWHTDLLDLVAGLPACAVLVATDRLGALHQVRSALATLRQAGVDRVAVVLDAPALPEGASDADRDAPGHAATLARVEPTLPIETLARDPDAGPLAAVLASLGEFVRAGRREGP